MYVVRILQRSTVNNIELFNFINLSIIDWELTSGINLSIENFANIIAISLLLLIVVLLAVQSRGVKKIQQYQQNLEDEVDTRTHELISINEKFKTEIKERKQVEEAFAVRLRYEEALARSSNILLADEKDSIKKSLKYMLQISKACRVCYYKNLNNIEHGLSMKLIEEVCLPGVSSQTDEFGQIETYANGHEWLHDMFLKERIVRGKVDNLPEREREQLKKTGVYFIVAVSFKVRGEFYGFLAFHKTIQDREWDDDEVMMMQKAAFTIGAYIEQKHAQQELSSAKEAAERASLELHDSNIQLETAREDAERSSAIKSEFLTNVSHEMRTPLNCIIGFSENIIRSTSLDEIHQRGETLLQEAETLLLLINDLLDHAKIEAGKMDLEYRSFCLHSMLERIQNSIYPQVKKKGLILELNIAEDVPQNIVSDALRLRQILVNIVGNAVKFTETGEIQINIGLVDESATKAVILFSVVDTGIGISKEQQPKIFDSFTQADGSTTRKYGGTGLGISISKQLVEKMGGEIGLYSRVGCGTTFWFKIPFTLAPEGEVNVVDSVALVENELDNYRLIGKVLLAEDYPANQEIVCLHLRSVGLEIVLVENGEDAVKAANEEEFDLILMDVQMPLMDGFEAAKIISAENSKCRNVPIVALTANANAVTRKMCKESGMKDVVTKPIRRRTFITKISKWLECPDSAIEEAEFAFQNDKYEGDLTSDSKVTLAYDEILEEFGGNKSILHDLYRKFVILTDNQLFAVRSAAVGLNADGLRRESHKLKGSAGSIGARYFSALSEKLEHCGEHNRMEAAMELVFELEEEFCKLKDIIETLD